MSPSNVLFLKLDTVCGYLFYYSFLILILLFFQPYYKHALWDRVYSEIKSGVLE